MDKLIALADLNYFEIFLGIVVVIIAYKFLSELLEWFIEKMPGQQEEMTL